MYVPADVDASVVEQRIFEQAHRLRSGGAVSGWAALRWYGARYFSGQDVDGTLHPVTLVLGRQPLRGDPRVSLDLSQIAPSERSVVAGISVATVQRSLFDVMRRSPGVRSAVVAMDMAAAAGLISVELMSAYVDQRAAWTGVPQVRAALALASNESWSPMEPLFRLVWVLDAMLDPPLCNRPVFDLAGNLLGYPDLFDAEAGMVGEYDGEYHDAPEQRRRDREREERFRDHGLAYVDAGTGDLPHRAMLAERIHAVRRTALFLPEDRRQWTLDPPEGWLPVAEPLHERLVRAGLAEALTHI